MHRLERIKHYRQVLVISCPLPVAVFAQCIKVECDFERRLGLAHVILSEGSFE